jgi:hypothetical protein
MTLASGLQPNVFLPAWVKAEFNLVSPIGEDSSGKQVKFVEERLCLAGFAVKVDSNFCSTTTGEQWTYVLVWRMALFLVQTLLANLKWVLFEPNAEALWGAIRTSIKAFMLGLFKQGASQARSQARPFS